MIDFNQEGLGTPLVIPSEHGSLHGSLVLQPNSPGLIVLAHAALALDGLILEARRLKKNQPIAAGGE